MNLKLIDFKFNEKHVSFFLNETYYSLSFSCGNLSFRRKSRELYSVSIRNEVKFQFQIMYLHYNKPSFWIKDGLNSVSFYLDTEKIRIVSQDSVFTHYLD